jgi:L-alanine-DL-glutamate epimerase-like enolase superfamily enzyme
MANPVTAASFERRDLSIASTFRTSRGASSTTTNHLVTVTDGAGRVGVGGAAPAPYYDETPESVASVLPDLLDIVEGTDPRAQQRIERRLAERASDEAAARAAVSVAVHDLAARQRGEPLFCQWGLDPACTPRSSLTVSIDTPAAMARRASEYRAAGYPVLKVKLGTDADRERLAAVREAAPDARLRVDINGDWSPDEAVENSSWLADAGVELLEQPVPADDIAGLRRVSEATTIPVAADESCVRASDVPRVADAVDVVVVKLMKCGGLRPARRQIETAHAHGLAVMLGCMVETSASIAGAAHLAPLVAFADLDGALLLVSDPCSGPVGEGGRIALDGVERGTGARLD